MRVNKKWALGVVGAAALMFSAASQAQAGIDLGFVGDVEGGSFRMDFTASSTSSDTANNQVFDEIRGVILGPVAFTVTAGTFVVNPPARFEADGAQSGNGSGDHPGIAGFNYDEDNDGAPTGANGWAQTAFTPNDVGPGATFLADEVRAASANEVGVGDSLAFSFWFEKNLTDGTHFFIEFYNNGVFVTGYEIKRKDGSLTNPLARGFESVNFTTPFVPLPASVWSGMALMGGLGLMLARRRRNAIIA